MREYGMKLRAYPNTSQMESILVTLDCVRYIWNKSLEYSQETYRSFGMRPSMYDVKKLIPKLKRCYEWLRGADSVALQQTVRNLDTAYRNHFKNPDVFGFPRFKSRKRRDVTSYVTTNGNRTSILVIDDYHIKLPKLGIVKVRGMRSVTGEITSATVRACKDGRFEVVLHIRDDSQVTHDVDGLNPVGVDAGIKNLVTTSEGVTYQNPKHTKRYAKKLAREQRRLSKCDNGSNRYEKQRRKVARVHRKIRDSRLDNPHKTSHDIVMNHSIVCCEDLNVNGMVKNHHVAKSVTDASMSELIRQLEYKCSWYGRRFVQVSKWYASSKSSHVCGHRYENMRLDERDWTCDVCGTRHDRDVNASVNILNEGLRILNNSSTASHTETGNELVVSNARGDTSIGDKKLGSCLDMCR